MDPHQLGDWVRHQIATHCEPQFEDEQARSHDKRYLTHRREADGSLRGSFRIAAEDSETYLTALEPLARKDGDDDRRTAGQRRADALVDLADRALRHDALPAAGGLRPQLSYVLPAGWAAAQQQQATCTDCGPRCADHQPLSFADTVAAAMPGAGGIRAEQACATAAWTGPQTRARLEAMLCEARITKVLLDSPGRSAASNPCATTSPPPNAEPSPPATSPASPAAAPDHPPCATPTTCATEPTAARPPSTTSCCCADAITSCGTKASSASTSSPSPGTKTSAQPLDDLFGRRHPERCRR